MRNITCPPAAAIAEAAAIDINTAKAVRALIKKGYFKPSGEHWSHAATAWFEKVADLAEYCSGVESLPGYPHLLYCNAGDTYTPTLVFNHETGAVRITSIGDIVERQRPVRNEY
jgi:hypothetical protein